jgi:hypothetical protein
VKQEEKENAFIANDVWKTGIVAVAAYGGGDSTLCGQGYQNEKNQRAYLPYGDTGGFSYP